VAVVEFEKTRFLVGGTSSSLVLLSRLQDSAARTDDEAESCPPRFGVECEEKPGKNRGTKNVERPLTNMFTNIFPRVAPVIAFAAFRPKHVSGLNWTGLGGASGSVPWNIVVLLTLLTLLPALLVALTPFTRLLIVVPFFAAGAGHADRAQQPDADRPRAGVDLLPECNRWGIDLSGGGGALSAGPGGRDGRGGNSGRRRCATSCSSTPGKRSGAVSRTGRGAASGASRGRAHAGGGAGRTSSPSCVPDFRLGWRCFCLFW